jgi:hypothetical protein
MDLDSVELTMLRHFAAVLLPLFNSTQSFRGARLRANPESSGSAGGEALWIPGSVLRTATE